MADVLPDSQCGFRAGRGCNDVMLVARQLVEKAQEHHITQTCLYCIICGFEESV